MRRRWAAAALLAAALGTPGAATAQRAGANPALVETGRFLATAGDCAGCHGTSLAGGDPVASPIGKIYASNITPDAGTGIGSWTLGQFTTLMRRGRAPGRHIFPAMPYTSYTGLGDGQIAALYSYLQLAVAPVRNVPPETRLPFPFVRPAMIAWNALFLDEGHPIGAPAVTDARALRGQVFVEALGHCTACHTPRGQLMQPLSGRHLGGGMVNGWWAPNISPGEGGIGDWSDERLAAFLRTGHTDSAVAAGEMGTVVSRSLSKLPPEAIGDIVAYLRAIPPVASATGDSVPRPSGRFVPAASRAGGPGDVPDPVAARGWQGMLAHDALDGGALYQAACAACHGMAGQGSAGLAHPSLLLVGGVTARQGSTLVQVIAHGVNRTVDGRIALMPGFRGALTDAQIAALASYVRATFGGDPQALDAGRVSAILDGSLDTPWLIRNATWLAVAGFAIAAMIALLAVIVIWAVLCRGRRRGPRLA